MKKTSPCNLLGLLPALIACVLLFGVSTFWPSIRAQTATPPLLPLTITNDATAAQGLTNIVQYATALKSNYGVLYGLWQANTNAAAQDANDKSNAAYWQAQDATDKANSTMWSNQVSAANSNALYFQNQNAGLVSNVATAAAQVTAVSTNTP